VVRRHKRRRRPRETHRGRPEKAWRHCARVVDHPVSLAIHICHAEGGIEQRLVWICRRSRQIVVIESAKQLPLCAQFLIDANRELICIRDHVRGCRIGTRTICTRGIVG
jgi:hypothetical protein